MSSLLASIGTVKRDEDAAAVHPRTQHARAERIKKASDYSALTGIGHWEGVNETTAILSAGIFADKAEAVIDEVVQFGNLGCGNLHGYCKSVQFARAALEAAREAKQESVWIGCAESVSGGSAVYGVVIDCDYGTIIERTYGHYAQLNRSNHGRFATEACVKALTGTGRNYTLALGEDLSKPLFSIVDRTEATVGQ